MFRYARIARTNGIKENVPLIWGTAHFYNREIEFEEKALQVTGINGIT